MAPTLVGVACRALKCSAGGRGPQCPKEGGLVLEQVGVPQAVRLARHPLSKSLPRPREGGRGLLYLSNVIAGRRGLCRVWAWRALSVFRVTGCLNRCPP